MMSDLYLLLEILGYGFVSCCCVGIVVCTSKLLQNCYDKYVLRLPAPEEPVNVNNPFYNLEGRYAKAEANVIVKDVDIHIVDISTIDYENVVETNIIALEII